MIGHTSYIHQSGPAVVEATRCGCLFAPALCACLDDISGPRVLVLIWTVHLRLIHIQGGIMLIGQEIQAHLPVNEGNIEWILGDGCAQRTLEHYRDFRKRHHRLDVDEREATDGDIPRQGRHTGAHGHGAVAVHLGVAEELAVLVVDVEARVADDFLRGRELWERRGFGRQVPQRRVAGPPVERHQALGFLVVHNAAQVVLVVDDVLVFEGDRVDGDDGRGRVGPILRECCPDDFAVVVNSADVILDVSRRSQCRIGDPLALAVVDQDVSITGSG